MNRVLSLLCLGLILSIFVLLEVGSATNESLSYDESVYLSEGKTNITKRTFLVDPYNPPLIRELTAIPLLFHLNSDKALPNMAYFPSRLLVIGFGVLLLLGVFSFLYIFFGELAAFLGVLLLVFEPTFLANSHYITPDVGAVLFFFLAWFSYRLWIIRPTGFRFLIFSATAGFTAAAKLPNAMFLICSVIVSFFVERNVQKLWNKRNFVVFVGFFSFVIWGTFWFQWRPILAQNNNANRFAEQIKNYSKAHTIPVVATIINALYTVPVPMGDYLGLIKNTALRARSPRQDYVLGALVQPNFFTPLSALLVKTPIPFAILLFIAILLTKRKKDIFVVGIPILSVIFVNMVMKVSPLARYFLPGTVFLCLYIASRLVDVKEKYLKLMIAILFVWYIAGTILSYPHFITYSNEFAANDNQKIQLFQDSNIDWGQGLVSFSRYVHLMKPRSLLFSYFGRDDASKYGFVSIIPWGSYKNYEICAFHPIQYPLNTGESLIAISVTNWQQCGYREKPDFQISRLKAVVAHSILVFPYRPRETNEDSL